MFKTNTLLFHCVCTELSGSKNQSWKGGGGGEESKGVGQVEAEYGLSNNKSPFKFIHIAFSHRSLRKDLRPFIVIDAFSQSACFLLTVAN